MIRWLTANCYQIYRTLQRKEPGQHVDSARCVECGIRFLTSKSNRGREDLRCPFGCRELNRRRKTNERGKRYYNSKKGRKKKKQRNKKRCLKRRSSEDDDSNSKSESRSNQDVDPLLFSESPGDSVLAEQVPLFDQKNAEANSIKPEHKRPGPESASCELNHFKASLDSTHNPDQQTPDPPFNWWSSDQLSYIRFIATLLSGQKCTHEWVHANLNEFFKYFLRQRPLKKPDG